MTFPWRRIAIANSVVVCAGMAAFPAQGQQPRRTVEIFRGGNKQVVTPAGPKPVGSPQQQVPKPVAVLPSETNVLVDRVAAQSREAFRVGLMSLGDHLEQLRVIHRVELQLALQTGNKANLESAAEKEVQRMRDITLQLEAMRQPAAAGWEADGLLARTVLADAKWELARIRGDADGAASAQVEFSRMAVAHLNQRMDDATLGMASFPTLTAAISMARGVTGPGQTTADAAANQARLEQQVVLTTSRWNTSTTDIGKLDPKAVGGIGRLDEVQQARVDSAIAEGRVTLMNQDAEGFKTSVMQADGAAKSMFDSRMEFFQKGTASLFDITKSWLVRTRVQEMSSELKGFPTEEMTRGRREDLEKISKIATSMPDLRGRNSADIGFVLLLQVADSADILARPLGLPEDRPALDARSR